MPQPTFPNKPTFTTVFMLFPLSKPSTIHSCFYQAMIQHSTCPCQHIHIQQPLLCMPVNQHIIQLCLMTPNHIHLLICMRATSINACIMISIPFSMQLKFASMQSHQGTYVLQSYIRQNIIHPGIRILKHQD